MISPKDHDIPAHMELEVSERDLKNALDLISTQIHTRGKIPDILPGTQDEQEQLRSILQTLKTTQNHMLELSEGKLDSPIELRGPFGGALKNLQSNLRHLTWKTQAIAKGDFSQRVDFLHDFSVAFNSMVKDLDEAKKTLLIKNEEIQKTNTSLFISKEQYKSLILTSPVSICVVKDGSIILANPAFYQMLRISSPDSSHNDSFFTYIHQDRKVHFCELISLSIESEVHWNQFEEEMICTDGTVLDTEFIASDIIFDNEPSTLFFIHDITTRKQNELQILSSLHEKEILLKEVYHRVKNNLQIIWSLLSMQSRVIKDDTIKGYFVECQNRVKSLALVHENLYRTDNLRDINYREYLTQITTHLFRTYKINSENISLKIDADDETIPLVQAVPCSLIVNELISNSLKYAFNQKAEGTILITFRYDPVSRTYLLDYRDSGPGLSGVIDLSQAQTLGMRLIFGLVRQLKGTVYQKNDPGVHFIIRFPSVSGCDSV